MGDIWDSKFISDHPFHIQNPSIYLFQWVLLHLLNGITTKYPILNMQDFIYIAVNLHIELLLSADIPTVSRARIGREMLDYINLVRQQCIIRSNCDNDLIGWGSVIRRSIMMYTILVHFPPMDNIICADTQICISNQ